MSRYFVPITQPKIRNSLLDFSPVNQSLNAIGEAQQNASRNALMRDQMAMQKDQQQWTRDRAAKQDALDMKDRAGKAALAVMKIGEEDPARAAAMWPGILSQFGDGNHPPDEQDWRTGAAKLAAAAGLSIDRMERQTAQANLDLLRAQTAKAKANAQRITDGFSPENYKVVDGRLLRIGPDGPADVTPFDRRDRGQEAINKEFFKTDAGTVSDYRKEADDAMILTDKLDRLEAARSQAKGRPGPVSARLPSFSPAAQMVDSAATEIQLEFTKQTKGAITEREMALFANATPGWQMTDEAARPVLDAMRVAADRKKERAKFFDTWLRSRQSLSGAAEAWSAFMRDNPIIEQAQDGRFRVNKNNVGNWRNYLSGEQQQAAQPEQPQQRRTIDAGDGFTVEY